MKRVIVGLSGGVDSSVTAYLLKEQGYEVIGLFMKNWHDDSVTISNECPWLEDSNDAMIVAEKLGIPFQVVDLSEQYKERIVDYMFDEYSKGRTPNPDVLCNREIKFDVFMDIALNLGADYVATGHYCRKGEEEIDGKSVYKLLAGKDVNKDQSYFLCQLSQQQLAKALFPIGELTKPEVREIAKKADLITAEKKDSQGLCFIGKVRLPEFLQQKLQPKEGEIITIPSDYKQYTNSLPKFENKEAELKFLSTKFSYTKEDGIDKGEHNGAHYFTTGQRKGLGIAAPNPLYVLAKEVSSNRLVVGEAEELGSSEMLVGNINWISGKAPVDSFRAEVKIRYTAKEAWAEIKPIGADQAQITFDVPQRDITPGQAAVFYAGEICFGGGAIQSSKGA